MSNKHHEFEKLLRQMNISRKELACDLGMKYLSVTNQLAPGKDLPRWATAMLLVSNRDTIQEEDLSKIDVAFELKLNDLDEEHHKRARIWRSKK